MYTNRELGYELYLAHHGVKGMKWGVRRYQNPDGSLTAKGKKRYYDKDGKLSKKGQKFNKDNEDNLNRLVDTASKNIKNDDKYKQYVQLEAKNRDHYLKNRDDWFQQKGKYKGKDYYQFKDISYKDWMSTKDGKEQQRLKKEIDKLITDGTGQLKSFNGKTSYQQLKNGSIETIKIGEAAASRLINKIAMDAYKDAGAYTTYKEKGGK